MTNPLTSVAYGNGHFIAVGFSYDGLASADGTNWTRIRVDFTPSPKTIRFVSDQFVLIRDSGTILTSTNGSNWSQRFSARPGTSYSGIDYGNGRYVAVGSHGQVGGNGNVAVSPDALTWTPLDIGQSNYLYAVAFGSGLFVAVGGLNGGVGGLILSSSDGANWAHHPPGTRGWLADIAYDNGRFVAVGSFGTILLSQPVVQLEPLTPLLNGAMQFRLTGPSGQTCAIQASTDFDNWRVLTNLVLTNGSGQFIDRSAADFDRRFYRVAGSP